MKKACYTVMVGSGYQLRKIKKPCEGWTYHCFTDQDIESDQWVIHRLDGSGISAKKQSRIPKVCCTANLPFADISVYMDSRFTPIADLTTFAQMHLIGADIAVMKHHKRDCIYQEAKELKMPVVNNQVNKYRAEGMPEHFGLFAPGVMVRRHTEELAGFLDFWMGEILAHSHRDQVSLAYSMWKNPSTWVNLMPFRKTYELWMGR